MKMLWKRIKFLEIKKNSSQTRMDFYAVLVPTFLSRELFKNNRDIKEVTDRFRVETSLKDYLYDSRTALVARIIREVQDSTEEDLDYNVNIFKERVLDIMEKKGLENTNEVTKIINKYSRNNKEEIDE
ncbi:hypothetical protein PVK73_17500 [Bacillus thuringiensis]